MTLTSEHIHSLFDIESGRIGDRPLTERMLGDMAGYYADQAAFADLLAQGNMLHYTVSAVEPAGGEGDLHYAIARLLPGQVGQEYFMTKGHFHAWRPAAEYYIGLSGEGMMLMESEDGSESRLVPLTPDAAVYVPGHIAHRTINTGKEPLVYLGVYPAQAGHDYGTIAERNFLSVVVEIDGKPTQIDREAYTTMLGVEQDLRD